ncbi:MAG: DUF4038 domain-containing protein [Bacteroidota bacterium]
MNVYRSVVPFWMVFCFCSGAGILQAQLPKLAIAENQRFLVREDGKPFVWIGETNWLFAKLPPKTIDRLLDVRSQQGFTVMFVSCREDRYDGGGPGKITQPNEIWWAYLDEYLEKCEQRNLYVGITLGWWGIARNHTAEELYQYGKWVGNRYKDRNNLIWLTLGEAGSHERKKGPLPAGHVEALVKGIREGDTGNKLLTIHADFRRSTSITDHAALCDFNNWQTSQWCCRSDLPRKDDRTWTVWEAIQYDYQQRYEGKPKPTLDSEAWYEQNKDFCGVTSFYIRRRAYFTLFAGAFGHTYGAGGIWDGLTEAEACSGDALAAIQYPGARDMGYVSRFLHRLGADWLQLRPDQSFVASGNSEAYDTHLQSTIAENQSFALVYSASDHPYTIDVSRLAGKRLVVSWYNPRTDEYLPAVRLRLADGPQQEVDPPGENGPGNDWVLMVGKRKGIQELR